MKQLKLFLDKSIPYSTQSPAHQHATTHYIQQLASTTQHATISLHASAPNQFIIVLLYYIKYYFLKIYITYRKFIYTRSTL